MKNIYEILKSFEITVPEDKKEDFDIGIEEAKMNGSMILVIDEIHRMNKDKQDILLPLLENGLIILIGLTTSNPYYKINPAIRSRCQIFELHNLEFEDNTFDLIISRNVTWNLKNPDQFLLKQFIKSVSKMGIIDSKSGG